MNQAGREVRSIKPAYVKDKRVFKPNLGLKRAVGEQIGGSVHAAAAHRLAIAGEAQDQLNLLTRARRSWRWSSSAPASSRSSAISTRRSPSIPA
jgi:hypothetical protein